MELLLSLIGIVMLIGVAVYVFKDSLKPIISLSDAKVNELTTWFKGVKLPKFDRNIVIQKSNPTIVRPPFSNNIPDTNNIASKHAIESSMKDENITNAERDFMWVGMESRRKVPCINCKKADMYMGPENRTPAMTWICTKCGQVVHLNIKTGGRFGFECVNRGVDRSWIKK